MDWNPSFEQELQHIQIGRAQQQQPYDHEYGYSAQQSQAQQQYSQLSDNGFGMHYVPTIPIGQRFAAVISYSFAWATGFIFFIFAEKRNRFVRFHALQSFLFFGGISVLGTVAGIIINFGMSYNSSFGSVLFVPLIVAVIAFILLMLMAIAGWFMGIVNAFRGRYYKMPFVGDFVERYINNQATPK